MYRFFSVCLLFFMLTFSANAAVKGGIRKSEEFKNYNQIIDSRSGKGIPNAKEFSKERVRGVRTAQSILNVNEVTLDEIYTHIQGFTKESLLLLKELELQTEIEFTQVNLDMFAVYQWCVQNGKKIIG